MPEIGQRVWEICDMDIGNGFMLKGRKLSVMIDRKTGSLTSLYNGSTNERYLISEDGFEILADEFELHQSQCSMISSDHTEDIAVFRYQHDVTTVSVKYYLRSHFVEKHISVFTSFPYTLRKIVVSRPCLSVDDLIIIVPYRYQQNTTFFGRTDAGGFFAGMEMPFDTSCLDGDQITLGYRPGLKVPKEIQINSEKAYFGVYKRYTKEKMPVFGKLQEGNYCHLPLISESAAMLSMTAQVLGPSRHGATAVLLPLCCGGISLNRTDEKWFDSKADFEKITEILRFAADCGIKWVQDYLPWGGEFNAISKLGEEVEMECHPWLKQLICYYIKLGLKPVMWSTMNNVDPWAHGSTFRPDRPDYLVKAPFIPFYKEVDGNCLGSDEYQRWYTAFVLERMRENGYQGFSLDGDFNGGPGWYTTSSVPLRCLSTEHDHVPGEAQYACMKGLEKHLGSVRQQFSDAFIWLMRPMMDLGVWSYKNGDAVFTILEDGKVINLTGIAGQCRNVTFGDKIRIWSGKRRNHHFCPHYLDQIQLFPSCDGGSTNDIPWDGYKLDYLMISAISSSPNQCILTGPVGRIPPEDRETIKKWIEWSKKNEKYLLNRNNLSVWSCTNNEPGNWGHFESSLPVWPRKGSIDGSIHFAEDRGYVFLFNPNPETLLSEFELTDTELCLYDRCMYKISQIYPEVEKQTTVAHKNMFSYEIEGFSAVILEIIKEGS